jgi:predicted ATPase/DNA-binding SARP family transcriptional activator
MTHLSVDVLGSLQVSIADSPIKTLESVKVCALLAYLAVEADRPHRRETLVGLLWPEFPEQIARHNLRQALFNLRLAIGDHTANHPHLLVTRDAIQFNRESDYSLDLAQFNAYFLGCEKNMSRCIEDCSIRAGRLEKMVKLYRGEFLHQLFLDDSTEFEQWLLMQRESTHQRVLEAHSYLANYYELHADFQAAQRHASRQLELDPWREEAHRQMMQVLALDGQRSAALVQYDTCRRVLAEELDVEPSVETRELYEQIRLGTLKLKSDQPFDIPSTPILNLPVQLTPFIGREPELAHLGQLIADPECRCITLVGPGGMGKTRLAVQAAETHLNEFALGGAFVPLASVGSIDGVISAIANAIDLTFYGPQDPKANLLSFLHEKQMLLVLDNVEQLLIEDPHQENIAQLLIEILKHALGVKLLVTSREALNLQEEWLFAVQGLAFPETPQTEGFDEFDAVALFVQRARRAFPHFTLNDENRAEVAHICRLVEGMPLAIELAATWMRILSPAEIAKEIENNLDFLSTTVRDVPERHRSMRAVFDRSWQMLSVDEQQVLCKLSIFRGGFQRQAAEQVAGASLSILSTLVNRTFLRRAAAGRYDMHELVRQYCVAQLDTDPQLKAAAQSQHYAFFLTLAETAGQELKGSNQLEWLGRLVQEHDNLQAALEWALENQATPQSGDELALRLVGSLRWYWRMGGHIHEGCDCLTEALGRYPEKRTNSRAGALLGMSILMNSMGDLSASLALAEESAAIFLELGDMQCMAESLMISGLSLFWQGEATLGQARTREALAIFRNVGDRWGEAQALFRLGWNLSDYGGDPAGRVMLEESAAILEKIDEKYLYTSVMISLGIIELSLGDYTTAQSHFEGGLATAREIRHPLGIADALTNLGCLFRIKGEYATAQSLFEESLLVYQEHGYYKWQTDVHCAMAENAIAQGDCSTARLHLQTASNFLGSSDNRWLQVLVCYFRGLLANYEGDTGGAAELLEETVVLAREGQFKPDLARSLVTLGSVRLRLGEVALATGLLREGLGLFLEFGHKLGIAIALEALASVSLVQGDGAHAVVLFSTANALRQAMGAPLPPIDQSAYDSAVAACRAQLGDAFFTDLWSRTAARPFKQVVEELLNVDDAS